ncbi:hypothetical protein WJX82_001045 [Trebouxia sp. C0006]
MNCRRYGLPLRLTQRKLQRQLQARALRTGGARCKTSRACLRIKNPTGINIRLLVDSLLEAMLTSLLQEVPHLLNSMPPPLLKTLLATNSTIRQVVHQRVQSITIFNPEDVLLLARADWPNMTSLDLEYELLGDEIAWLLQDCSRLTSLSFAMSRMVLTNWPNLTKLVLCHNFLDTAAIGHLVQGKWPMLEWLDLSSNELDDLSIEALAQGLWPKLKSLNISHMGVSVWAKDYDAASLGSVPGHLVQGWQLEEIVLLDTMSSSSGYLSINAIQSLVKSGMTSLKCLDLTGYVLEGGSAARLAESKWPQLVRLRLNIGNLDPNTVGFLVKADWPLLRHLAVSGISVNLNIPD